MDRCYVERQFYAKTHADQAEIPTALGMINE